MRHVGEEFRLVGADPLQFRHFLLQDLAAGLDLLVLQADVLALLLQHLRPLFEFLVALLQFLLLHPQFLGLLLGLLEKFGRALVRAIGIDGDGDGFPRQFDKFHADQTVAMQQWNGGDYFRRRLAEGGADGQIA